MDEFKKIRNTLIGIVVTIIVITCIVWSVIIGIGIKAAKYISKNGVKEVAERVYNGDETDTLIVVEQEFDVK